MQDEVVIVEDFAELGGETFAMKQVGDPEGAARHLVFIGRADAAPGGTDGILALRLLARLIERDVRCQDQRTGRTHPQAFEYRHALPDQHFRFLEERLERQHHAIADEALHMRVQDSRRNQRQNRFFAADDQRVSGIVAALKAHHRLHLIGQ